MILRKGDVVRINNSLSRKRKGEIARVKWTPSNDTYVTVVFKDGCSGKYKQQEIIKVCSEQKEREKLKTYFEPKDFINIENLNKYVEYIKTNIINDTLDRVVSQIKEDRKAGWITSEDDIESLRVSILSEIKGAE